MLRLPSTFRYISSYAAVSVVASAGYSVYRTAEPAKRLPFINEAFSVLLGLQLFLGLSSRGKPFIGTLLTLSWSYAMLRGLEKLDRKQLAMFYAAVMIWGLFVELFTKSSTLSHPPVGDYNSFSGDPGYPPQG